MAEHDIPKGVSLDTLHEILAGWSEAGAAEEPRYTTDVEEVTSVSDVVGRQTRFLEEIGVLEPHKQQHVLTDSGQELASALAKGDEECAREQARALLSEWELTQDVRDALESAPMDREELTRQTAEIAEQDLETSRVKTGITTLIDLWEWAGILERDEVGRYRPPESEKPTEAAAVSGDGTTETEAGPTGTARAREAAQEAVEVAESATEAAEAAAEESTEAPGTEGESIEGTAEPLAEESSNAAKAIEQTIEEVTEQAVAETAEATAQDAAREVAEETARKMAAEIAGQVARDVAENTSDELVEEAVQQVTGAAETAEEAAERSKEAAKTVEGQSVEETAKSVAR
ncbi:MAG: hypothetical protein ABEI52_10375, partial [Halobacteriaceae archaeon]